ncbi:hypothetical protein G6L28_01510 [Agrobacterium larrymoorei]|uniref:hypothetical protein n=1 Tax=Agrobacterium larrymoorei TaxID=160699 RepID=UPI0015736523|nr:hypothetical protein [Agrobacterium larrymoorei]NTJ41276.1 hypothetical protein [Agrobacterium larrymoorei]
MAKIFVGGALLISTLVLSGCQTWHSPYRGNEWRMDQVMDGDPFRQGDGHRGENSNRIIR